MGNISRRSFVIQSLATTGLAARSLSAAQAGEKLRVGIVGCGRLGQQYAEVYLKGHPYVLTIRIEPCQESNSWPSQNGIQSDARLLVNDLV